MNVNSNIISGNGYQPQAANAPVGKLSDGQSVKLSNNASHAPTESQVNHALEQVNNAAQVKANDLKFSVDKSTGMRVVQVIDASTNEVLRQFPSEEVLHIAQGLDKLQGMLLKNKV